MLAPQQHTVKHYGKKDMQKAGDSTINLSCLQSAQIDTHSFYMNLKHYNYPPLPYESSTLMYMHSIYDLTSSYMPTFFSYNQTKKLYFPLEQGQAILMCSVLHPQSFHRYT